VGSWVVYSTVTGYYLYRCSARQLDKSLPKQVRQRLHGASLPTFQLSPPGCTGCRHYAVRQACLQAAHTLCCRGGALSAASCQPC
jgi:hypothetical protein